MLIPASELDLTKPLYVGVLDGRQGGIPSTSFAVPVALQPSDSGSGIGMCGTVSGACVLVPGVPQRLVLVDEGEAGGRSTVLLTVAASGHEAADLQISAVPTYGDPDIYVTAGPAATPRWPQAGDEAG